MSNEFPHRRYDPLSDRWVLVSPQRNQRPWQGQTEARATVAPAYSDDCYLCPGNTRAGGHKNPDYQNVYVFENDYPALLTEPHELSEPHKLSEPQGLSESDKPPADEPLFRSSNVRGQCRVICYSPQHNLTLSTMNEQQLHRVIDVWADQTKVLGDEFEHVQIFENRGETMGCSNAHPHGQIWAMDTQPSEILREDRQQSAYFAQQGSALLLDYALREQIKGVRTVYVNAHWIALVPWWATWPYETLLLPLQSTATLPDLTVVQRAALVDSLGKLLRGYDRLFAVPLPYSMGWHGAPRTAQRACWQLHAHFYPPLLRSATVRKHMVGFEMLGESQRDLTPELAAEQLRRVIQ